MLIRQLIQYPEGVFYWQLHGALVKYVTAPELGRPSDRAANFDCLPRRKVRVLLETEMSSTLLTDISQMAFTSLSFSQLFASLPILHPCSGELSGSAIVCTSVSIDVSI